MKLHLLLIDAYIDATPREKAMFMRNLLSKAAAHTRHPEIFIRFGRDKKYARILKDAVCCVG